jgi:DNA repair protein RadC
MASAVIIVHNHPSGDVKPSNADKLSTERLVEIGKLVGIRLIDHVIIGHVNYK